MHWKGLLDPGMGPLRPKIVPFRPDMDPPKHTDYLLLLNVDSESLQYMIVGIENGPSGSERGVKFLPLTPSPIAAPQVVDTFVDILLFWFDASE